MDSEELRHRFKYHPPKNDETRELHEHVRQFIGDLAGWMNLNLPDGREKSLVFTHLEDAMMWANAAIARNQ